MGIDSLAQRPQITNENLVRGSETVLDRVTSYLPPTEILLDYPGPKILDRERREQYQQSRPGCDYALVTYKGNMVIVPAWHPLNLESQTNHGGQYGTGMFEGGSVEPVVGESGGIVDANAILFARRGNRMFNWSIPGRPGIHPQVSREIFDQAVLDYAAIIGTHALVSPDGVASRAYLRPSIVPGEGPLGIGIKNQTINANGEVWNWPSYFPDANRVYRGKGLILAAGPNQRLQAIHGKHASNYGDAARVGNQARDVGADEGLYFAPYPVNRDRSRGREVILDYHKDDPNLPDIMKKLAIADGPGEEIMAVTRDGKLWVPPMDVNRLGGTTAQYIVDHMAATVGLTAEERRFSLNDIATPENPDGRIIGLFFAGNASRIAPIGQIRLHGFNGEAFGEYDLQIPEVVRRLVDQYEGEVKGLIPPSDLSLLTPIDLEAGQKAREILDEIYAAWFQ